MGPYPQEGILEFDYEEVEEFVSNLRETIVDLEEDLEEMKKAKADLQGVSNSRAIMNYGEYNVDITDYKDTIDFYEAIADDLQEFLNEVDEQVKFTRNPNFYYDDQLIEEIEGLNKETEDLRNDNSICIVDREYTPFGPFERGNFFHKGSEEEQLIDHNDGRMEQWAEEMNNILSDLVESAEEVERLHKLYFEDIAIDDWKKSHDWHDGITEHSREIHNIGSITTTMMNLGTIPKSSYNASMGKKANPKKGTEVNPQEIDDYVENLLSKKNNNSLSNIEPNSSKVKVEIKNPVVDGKRVGSAEIKSQGHHIKPRMNAETGEIKYDYSHEFPDIVDNYASHGEVEVFIGGDGKEYTKIEISGAWQENDGTFEWIIDENEDVTHRMFNMYKGE